MTYRVGILVSDNMMPGHKEAREDIFELEEQMGKIVPAFARHDMSAEILRWRDAGEMADHFDAVLPLFVWDYFEGNQHAFLEQMKQAAGKTHIFNPYEMLKWNSEKSYLEELATKGAPVIRTLYMDKVTEAGINQAFETLQTDRLVIKPIVGGGAWRQVLYAQGDPFPDHSELPPEGTMVQAFLRSVQDEGEYSFLYFGGEFSHAVLKKAKSGDYRIQSLYGGTEQTYTPTDEEKAAAKLILKQLDTIPLYARVDLLRGDDGALKLIELELLEPYLYLPHAEGEGGDNQGALKLAETLKKRLTP
ncbi:MAG: hypothetical protein HKN36_04570 [Hellea sp.]|nr:hypothetical protein [Hellea sp.]